MRSPRAPGAGVTRAWISLGGDRSKFSVAPTGSSFNDGRTLYAAALVDRQADLQLSVGRNSAAERLAFRAAELRGAEP
jgi:hypothetical protein